MRQSNYPRGRVLTSPPPEIETAKYVLDTELLADIGAKSSLNYAWLYWLVTPIYLWAVIELIETNLRGLQWSPVPLLVLLSFNLLLALSQKRGLASRYRKSLSDPVERFFLSSSRSVTFGANGISSRMDAVSGAHYSWSIVKHLVFESAYVAVYLAANMVIIIPNSAFVDSASLEILKKFAVENALTTQKLKL